MQANRYDPITRRVILRPDASAYAKFHELAHKEQHDTNAVVFVAWVTFARVRVVRYFVTLWIEFDAYRRAKSVMLKLGLWTSEAQNEARSALAKYAALKPTPTTYVLPFRGNSSISYAALKDST